MLRRVLFLLLMIGFGYLFLRQQDEKPAGRPVAAQGVAAAASPTPAPRGQASQYNYMKGALDRAHNVTEQSRARTQADQSP